MIDAVIAWDAEDDPDGNVRHIADNGITPHEVQEVLLNVNSTRGTSRTSGRPITFGSTATGRRIAVVWETLAEKPLLIRPVTAFDIE